MPDDITSSAKRRPTIRQVANACGVSPMTVSFVINDKPGQVSVETRERVLKTIRELGYRAAPTIVPPPHARTTLTLGLIAGVHGDSALKPGYYSRILQAVLTRSDQLAHNVTIFTSQFHADIQPAIRTYCDGRCDGVLVVAPKVNSELCQALHERGTPLVAIGASGGSDAIASVDLDDVAEGARATRHLLGLGHRRIAFLGGPEFVESSRQRCEGYRQALLTAGIPLDPRLEICDNFIANDGFERLYELVRYGWTPVERPTAVFGWQDEAAVDAMRAMYQLGYRVPEEVSVIGINDDPSVGDLPLTTLRQPYAEIGAAGVDMLLAQIAGHHSAEDPPASRQRLFRAELILRSSTAPPPRRQAH